MSMFRRAAVATAILGAGLASTTGAAMATTSHGHGDGHGCSNTIDAKNLTKGGGLDVAGGDQVAAPINACHILDDNSLLNGNNVAALAGTITNGDTTTTSGIPDVPVTIPVIQS
jgi:hypothetical protein